MNVKHYSRHLPVFASSAATNAVATVNGYREFNHTPTDRMYILTNAPFFLRLKQKKYPKGYPNDEPAASWSPRHMCHECSERFPAEAVQATECGKCSHQLCSDCPLLAPKKGLPGPGPEELKLLHERLAQLSVE